jgi:stress-induced morphogen
MLGFQSRRLTVSALRYASATTRTSPVNELILSRTQPRHSPSTRGAQAMRSPSTLQYSTASSSTSENTVNSTTNSSAKSPNTSAAAPEKPDYLNDAESAIWDKLTAEFSPTQLLVQDISGGCGSMYGIEITSERFRGVGMLKQQRMVNAVLGDEMKNWHGVQLRTRIP